jgi:autophagy-related protein 18
MISVGFSPGGNFASLLYASEFKIFRLCPFQLFAKFERVYAKAISLSVQADWIALIGSGDDLEFSPRCIRLFNACENSEVTFIAEIAFSEAVMNVFLRDRMFFVCTESKVYGFEREYMQKTMSIDVLSGAYDSICISMNGLLAIPCSDFKGELEIYDAGKASGQKISRIEAHESRIACCLFSEDSKKIATCSEKGTIIRVFSVPNGEKLYSFRRGLQHAKNLSLGFNFDSTFLCCSSARNTIHIYSLEKEKTDR